MKQYKGIQLESRENWPVVSTIKFKSPYRNEHFRQSKNPIGEYKIAGNDHINNVWCPALEIKFIINEAINWKIIKK